MKFGGNMCEDELELHVPVRGGWGVENKKQKTENWAGIKGWIGVRMNYWLGSVWIRRS
jgi:hypothetical protein